VNVAVVGHTEWVQFAVVPRVPRPGEILDAGETFEGPGGGGGVAAVQLARMSDDALFFTALGDDHEGGLARDQLRGRYGVDLHAATRRGRQRRAFAQIDRKGERAITVIGERLVPHGDDDLPWDRLAECDAVYFTGGDAEALRRARAARVVVATPRAGRTLAEAGVEVDVLVASSADPDESVLALVPGAVAGGSQASDEGAMDPPPKKVVLTEGAAGGRWLDADGTSGRYAAVEPPAPAVDAFGCGDTFAAGLTYALGHNRPWGAALAFAAVCASHCLAGRGPYGYELPEIG
jgi:ribokinase